MPPLTPGTNKKMTEALKASFASWEKEQINRNIPKGKSSDEPVLPDTARAASSKRCSSYAIRTAVGALRYGTRAATR